MISHSVCEWRPMAIYRTLMLLLFISNAHGRKPKKPFPNTEREVDNYDADVFCKSQNRLIKTQESDEVIVVDTIPGNSILMQCKYCEEKDKGLPRTWHKQAHIFTGNITEVRPSMENNFSISHVFVAKDHSLVLKNVQKRDIGLYYCKTPYANSPKKCFIYLVNFIDKNVDDVKGTVLDFKNYTRRYISEIDKIVSHKKFPDENNTYLKVFTEWSDWSECDFCFRKEGFRYRSGKCRVKFFFRSPDVPRTSPIKYKYLNSLIFNEEQNTEKPGSFYSEVADPYSVQENIINLGIALSCRSQLLKTLNPNIYNITSRTPDFLLTEKCNTPCKGRPSRKGPRYKKSIILATGAHLTLVCPDSTIDSQVQWEHNKVKLRPNEGADYVTKTAEPRLYVDSFNTLYLFEVTENESGNYTCYVDGVQMQEVKIIVLTRSLFFTKEFTRHLKYLGYVFIFCFFTYLAGLMVTCAKIQSEKKVKKIPGKDGKKLLNAENLCESDCSS